MTSPRPPGRQHLDQIIWLILSRVVAARQLTQADFDLVNDPT